MRRGAPGITLVEVLVALAVTALALLVWVRLGAATARAERTAEVGRQLASWLQSELGLQRNVAASSGCLSLAPVPGWRCSLVRRCLDERCGAEAIQVTLETAEGRVVRGATAVWWPLQRAPVERTP